MVGMATDIQLRLLISAVDRAGRSLQQIGNHLRTIGNEAQAANQKAGATASRATQEMERLNAALGKVKAGFERVKSAGDKMAQVGTRIAAAGAAIGAAAFFPIKEAATFEKSMSRVIAVTEETGKTFEDLEKQARELGRTTQFTAEEAAGGMRFLGMAGLNTQQVFESIGPTLDLAAAGELSVAESADIATNIMSAFGKTTSDLTDIMDVLAQTAANSNTDVRQLADAISYAGPTAKAAGITFEDLAGRIGLLASNGIKGTRAGTNLRGIIAALVKPSTEAEEAIRNLGAEIIFTADGSLDLAATFDSLEKSGLNARDAFAIFRRTAGGAGVVFAEQSAKLEELAKKIDNADGAAGRMRKTMEDNLVGAFTILKSAVSGLLITLGAPLQDTLQSLALNVAKLTTSLADWTEKHPTLAKWVIGLTGAVGLLLAAVGAILIPLGLIASGLGAAGAAMASMSIVVTSTMIPALVALKAAIIAAMAAGGLFPPLLVLMAAAFAAVKVYQAVTAYGEMREAMASAWETAKRGIVIGKRLQKTFAQFKDIKIEGALSEKALPELKEFEAELRKSRAYWIGLQTELSSKAREKTFLGNMTDEAKEAAKELVMVNGKVRENYLIRNRVLKEIGDREEELSDIVKKATDAQIAAKKELSAEDKKRLDQLAKIDLATRQLELSAQEEDTGKVEAKRKLALDTFEQSEEAKTLASAKAIEERNKRIAAINAIYDKQRADVLEQEGEKELAQQEMLSGLEIQLAEVSGRRRLDALQGEYDAGLIGLEEYMAQRQEITESGSELELSAIQDRLAAAGPEERPAIELELRIAEDEAAEEMDKLLAQKDVLAEQLLQKEANLQAGMRDLRMRSLEDGSLEEASALELEALDAKHEAELQKLIDFGATKQEQAEIQALQDIERAQRVADAEKALTDLRMQTASDMFGNLGTIAEAAYGKQSKAAKLAFALQKALSVKQTLMSTFEGAQKAYTAMVGIPYIGPVVGALAAAAAVAAGLLRVANIRSQSVAEGGEIKGRSSHSKADNIPIWATAKEFMQPVPAVQYYGKDVMEGIRQRKFPREIFSGLKIPTYAKPAVPRVHYAAGGQVAAQAPASGKVGGGAGAASTGGGGEASQAGGGVKIMNFIDRQEFLAAIDSPEGTEAIVNIISQNSEKVQRVLK
jgi:TP901 family phage tail tape measure protein